MPLVSVIIVNWNGKATLGECLAALLGQTFRGFEVIVVDNGSTDGSLEIARKALSEKGDTARVVSLGRNAGFAAGNVEGLKLARGEFIALLNPDAEPAPSWLATLVEAMRDHPEVGICASKLLVHGSGLIDSAGDGYSTFLRAFKRGEGEEAARYDEEEFVFGACAGAALYRMAMIEEIGFLDEEFFIIHEDTDLNFRAQLMGWRALFVPGAVVQHRVRASIGHMSDTAVYYSLRNSELVRMKNVTPGLFLRCLPALLLGMMAEFIYFALRHRRLLLYLRAKRDAFVMLGAMLVKRRQTLAARKVDDRYLSGVMTSAFEECFLRQKAMRFVRG
jgi:GT2 family glycosyltransferase